MSRSEQKAEASVIKFLGEWGHAPSSSILAYAGNGRNKEQVNAILARLEAAGRIVSRAVREPTSRNDPTIVTRQYYSLSR